jgi:iron complex transport system permease protein
VGIAPTEVLTILAGRLGLELPWPATQQQETVLVAIRIPRVMATALVGAAWAVAGVAMQGLYRTPLADPALVGVGAGAALGAALAAGVVVAGGAIVSLGGHLGVAGGAVLAAGVAAVVIHRVATASGRVVVATMLLAGMALSALLGAITAIALAAGGGPELRSVTFWMLGSFAGVVGLDVLVGLLVLPCVVILARLGPGLDALALGRTEAGHLGVDVAGLYRVSTAVLALLVGVSVAIGGVIAFLALLVPSLVRAWIGPTHRWLTVGSALLGATLLVLADVLARHLFAPVELSVGVITTVVGAPFFLWLLLRDRGWLGR